MAARPKGPPGAAAVRAVEARLAKRWPPGLTVLTGDDAYHLDAAQKAILDHLLPDGKDDVALSLYGDRKVDVADLVSGASAAGMFSSRRVVLLRDVEALEGERGVLSGYAASPPEDSFLIVRAPKLDARRVLQKELLSLPGVLTFRQVGLDEAKDVLAEAEALASERGLVLEREAAEFLIVVCSCDLYRVASELDKLAAWRERGAKGRVTPEEAREVAAGGGSFSGWEVANAVLARDLEAALAASRRLAEAGEEPRKTLGGLAWRSRSMLQVKARIEAGEPHEGAARSVWAGVPSHVLLEGLARFRLEELLAFPGRLLRAGRTLNSRSIDPRSVVDPLLRDLAGRGPATPGERR